MIVGRCGHGSAVSGKKVFVVVGSFNSFEMLPLRITPKPLAGECFDPESRAFVALSQPPESIFVFWGHPLQTETIGKKVYIFQGDHKHVVAYDVEKGVWECISQMAERYKDFACTRVPNF